VNLENKYLIFRSHPVAGTSRRVGPDHGNRSYNHNGETSAAHSHPEPDNQPHQSCTPAYKEQTSGHEYTEWAGGLEWEWE